MTHGIYYIVDGQQVDPDGRPIASSGQEQVVTPATAQGSGSPDESAANEEEPMPLPEELVALGEEFNIKPDVLESLGLVGVASFDDLAAIDDDTLLAIGVTKAALGRVRKAAG